MDFRTTDSLAHQPRYVLQGNPRSRKDRLSAESVRIGNDAAESLSIQSRIPNELLLERTVMNRHG